MPLFCEAPQPDSAALRACFFGAGRKFTEDLVGVAQTTQLADAGRAVEGGGVTTRWVLMCESQLPICTGGRPEAAGATSRQLGTRTLLFAPRGASACLRRKERARELGFSSKPFWHRRLLHKCFTITNEHHAVQQTLLPERFNCRS